MYPQGKIDTAAPEYYPTAGQHPPPSMGIPAAAANQYYYSDGGATLPPPPALQVESRIAAANTTPWSTGLCDCCDDVGNCKYSTHMHVP